MDENVIHVSLLLSYSAWLHGLVIARVSDEKKQQKHPKNCENTLEDKQLI